MSYQHIDAYDQLEINLELDLSDEQIEEMRESIIQDDIEI